MQNMHAKPEPTSCVINL